ncbi:sigma-70 family RNA polymerase sigma factor [Allokutzneria albata]|uniref:RNA polymerase sigma-70 factor, ECF subfamily n=1 Tax=Allokutzneria albata TaxID=211114 RepID=A0A1G9YSD4_ALLAB|nr:sigma-70 family RNA polymerase sigma factor [Allokutzneria albata]SDN11555.1 RNA polymerase sigma-70 factor, ECF subfamily [Allokutzneria albata]
MKALRGNCHAEYDDELMVMLYKRFEPMVFAHVMQLTNQDRQWSEDVVQETLIRAWQNSTSLVREPDMLRGWLFTVARRIVIDGWRNRSARPQEVELTDSDVAEPKDEAEHSLSAMVIEQVLGKLSAEHRAAVYATYVCGRTAREAAEVLGIPVGTVKSRLHKATRVIRRALRDWKQ